jgi:peptidoglycan/LPS O-acetylase OafA/YrhL
MRAPLSDRYRPDIEALRAVVVLFHAFSDAMPGGFIGVDIFFVISGFLITGIIARELFSGRLSLLQFYGRRDQADFS